MRSQKQTRASIQFSQARNAGWTSLFSFLSLSLGFLIFVSAEQAFAQKEKSETFVQRLIRKNVEWSRRLDSFADGIDIFLAGRRVTTRKNETSVTFENSTVIKEFEGIHNTSAVNANLRLPNLEDYWQLKFTSYDENEERRNLRRGYLRQQPRGRNYGASIGLLQSFGPVKTRFVPRIELTNPLRVSHSLNFETVADIDRYSINPSLEFWANPDHGTGIYSTFHINIELSKMWSLTLLNDGEYEENDNKFTTNNGFSFGQTLNDKMALSYSLIFNSNNRENYHLEGYNLSVNWTHVLYRKILDYEVIPFVEFPRVVDFQPRPGLTLNINLTF